MKPKTIADLVNEAFASGYIKGTWAHSNIPGDNSRQPYEPEEIIDQRIVSLEAALKESKQ